MEIIRKALILFTMTLFFVGCLTQRNKTVAEMFETANEVYQDYLFEYGIDSTLFSSPEVVIYSNGDRLYRWIAKGAGNAPVGVEVTVKKTNAKKPEMVLIGDTDVWLPLVGSKKRK